MKLNNLKQCSLEQGVVTANPGKYLCITLYEVAITCAILIGCGFDVWLACADTADRHTELIRIYKQANQSYENGEYRKAAEAYEFVASRLRNGNVYYNLGNAYFKIGQRGRAILYYERAKRLMPRDKDIRRNLKYAISLNEDKQPVSFVSILNDLITINELTFLAFLFYLFLAAAFVLYTLFDESKVKKIARSAMPILAGMLLFSLIILFLLVHASSIPRAIVLVPEVAAKSAPDDGSSSLFFLHEGAKVEIKRSEERWSKISLPNGAEGWVANSAIGRI